ncbi:glycosyltransferase [Vibrio caribbeanicus]|uniref:glycosyltransferase n=1 Tax=Vibrio caribbeanicus TaxID=701175 RepID=UPI002283C393|nr:glycosyltransferase [Vibrio caribbeanicus]MCY9844249.1 glycosyltransferase [Vibrio caribbeanicus]
MKKSTFVSVIVPVDDNCLSVNDFIYKLYDYLVNEYSDFEVIILDIDSRLESEINALIKQVESIRHIRLTQRVSPEVVLGAGLENAIGDFVILLNPLYDDIKLLHEFVSLGMLGSDIVVGTSKNTSTLTYKLVRALSSKIIRAIGYNLPKDTTGSVCLSRRVINEVTKQEKYKSRLLLNISNIGYSITSVSYKPADIFEKKKIPHALAETFDMIICNSTKPLRWMSVLGIVGSSSAFLFSCYSILINLFTDQVADGWTTLVFFTSILFLILFIMLSFFGEYLARLLNDNVEMKEYSVIYERHSSVMINESRGNIFSSSESLYPNETKTGRKND